MRPSESRSSRRNRFESEDHVFDRLPAGALGCRSPRQLSDKLGRPISRFYRPRKATRVVELDNVSCEMNRRQRSLLIALLFFAPCLSAQGGLSVEPATPTTDESIEIIFSGPACNVVSGVIVANRTILIDLTCSGICGTVPPGAVNLGRLSAGDYHVELRCPGPAIIASLDFTVAQGILFVPTLQPIWLAVLAMSLAVVAAVSLRAFQ